MRLDIRRTGSVKNRDEIVGNNVRVKVVKNKVAPPFREVEFDIMYGEGISKLGEIIDLGVKAGVVEKSGSWFSYNSQRIGQGRDNAREFLKANPDMAAEIEQAVRKNAGDHRRRAAAWRGRHDRRRGERGQLGLRPGRRRGRGEGSVLRRSRRARGSRRGRRARGAAGISR